MTMITTGVRKGHHNFGIFSTLFGQFELALFFWQFFGSFWQLAVGTFFDSLGWHFFDTFFFDSFQQFPILHKNPTLPPKRHHNHRVEQLALLRGL